MDEAELGVSMLWVNDGTGPSEKRDEGRFSPDAGRLAEIPGA